MNRERKIFFCSIVFFIAIFFLSSTTVCSGEWTSVSLTSLPKKNNEFPAVAIVDNSVHVVWNTWVDMDTSVISYRRSLDNGKTWGDIVDLTNNSINAVYPAVSASGDFVHVAWKDFRDGNPEIYYIRSIDNGETWEYQQRLTFDDPRPTNMYDINIASEGNFVYLVWKDYRSGSSEIFFKMSGDAGMTWDDDQRLTYDFRASYAPVLCVDGNDIYIAFDDYGEKTNVCVLGSNDGGETWDPPYDVTMNETVARYLKPSVAVSENNVFLVWEDEIRGNPDVYFTKSLDGGKSYLDPELLTFNYSGSTNPKVYVYNRNVTVIWQYMHNNSFGLYFLTSDDGGVSWGEIQPLIVDGDYYDAEIAGDGFGVHVVCQDYHESGWADILHVVETGGKPVITSLSLSSDSISIPGSVNIFVDGYDLTYNNSEVTCFVQYSSSLDDWHDLNVTFNNNSWMSTIIFSKASIVGEYKVRVQLVNKDGSRSDWKLGSFVVTEHELSDTPGFAFVSVVFGIIFLLTVKRKFFNRKNGM